LQRHLSTVRHSGEWLTSGLCNSVSVWMQKCGCLYFVHKINHTRRPAIIDRACSTASMHVMCNTVRVSANRLSKSHDLGTEYNVLQPVEARQGGVVVLFVSFQRSSDFSLFSVRWNFELNRKQCSQPPRTVHSRSIPFASIEIFKFHLNWLEFCK